MDLDVSMRSSDCPYTVHFYGAMFREGDVWICMEVMDVSLDKFYSKVFRSGDHAQQQQQQQQQQAVEVRYAGLLHKMLKIFSFLILS